MGKQINFDYKGDHYTLEYNKRTVKLMENSGIIIGDFSDKPMTVLPELFRGAFRMHHKKLKEDLIDEIYKSFSQKEELLEALLEMYNEPIAELMEEPDEDDENLIKWEKTDF